MNLTDELRALAEHAPTTSMPAGLFDRARRRRWWRLAATGAAVLLVLLGGYALTLADLRPLPPAAGPGGIPQALADPPVWTDQVSDSPPGAAAVVFRGPAVPDRQPFIGSSSPTAVVGLTSDVYRVVYPSQASLALSPDGRTLLLPHLNDTNEMRTRDWRTDALDLVTGRRRTFATGVVPLGWSADGKHALLMQWNRWNEPDGLVGGINDMTVRVVAWPSGQTEWSVYVPRPDAVEGETNYPVALSPDGAALAVSTSHELRVYGRNGALRWKRPLAGQDVLAGLAAWRDDGLIAVVRRGALSSWAATGDASLTFVDAATGDERPGPGLPVARSVFSLKVVAWRGDTAYAVLRTRTGEDSPASHASFVRLVPGAAAPETILAPDGVEDLNVATDYVAVMRPAGTPSYGLSLSGLASAAVPYTLPVVLGVTVVVLFWSRRRRRIERLDLHGHT